MEDVSSDHHESSQPVSLAEDPSGNTPPAPTISDDNLTEGLAPSDQISFNDSSMPPIVDLATAGLRRSNRVRSMPNRLSFFVKVCALGTFLAGSWIPAFAPLHDRAQNIVFAAVKEFHSANKCFDGTLNSLHHMALLAGKENNETYTFKEMLKQPDSKSFVEAMLKEVNDHEERHHWEVVPRSQKPQNVKSILSIWSFKRKRHPDGRLNKHKARLCAHWGMQTWGVNYWETYAPTVNWISVRFLLILAQILDLDTRAIDYVLAFPHADLEVPVYMELPAGMEIEGSKNCILKLRKSLYGLKSASYNWHQKLKAALERRDFVESLSDPCVFIGKYDSLSV